MNFENDCNSLSFESQRIERLGRQIAEAVADSSLWESRWACWDLWALSMQCDDLLREPRLRESFRLWLKQTVDMRGLTKIEYALAPGRAATLIASETEPTEYFRRPSVAHISDDEVQILAPFIMYLGYVSAWSIEEKQYEFDFLRDPLAEQLVRFGRMRFEKLRYGRDA